MKREELILALGDLGYPLVSPAKKRITDNQILEILGELAVSSDTRLIESFPVVLATCGQRGLKLDIQTFLARQRAKSQRRRNLEKLLVISSILLGQEELEQPKGLEEIVKSLKDKYKDLRSAEVVLLDKGVVLSIERLSNALKRYLSYQATGEKEKARQRRSFQQQLHLSTLFSPKQKELISKKLKGEPLTKTEQEYYSRVIRKKLEALADSEVRKIATRLTKK